MKTKAPVLSKFPMLLSLSALLICGAASSQIQKLLVAPDWVAHSDEVTQVATRLQKLIVTAPPRRDDVGMLATRYFQQLRSLVSDNHFQEAQVRKIKNLWTQKLDNPQQNQSQALISKDLDRQMDIFIAHEKHLRELKSSLATFAKYVALHG